MTSFVQVLSAFAASALAGCVNTPAVQLAAGETPSATECVKTTGTNICRTSESGNMNVVNSISADDLRRSGGPITGARPGTTGN